ncbi:MULTISPECIES: colicin-like pore-forming protein [unclassified Pseudomonas]|uniref:colicin-like pore-forming protein n=1 Tax=unclassified Pseudomonas TaxID=196821 RepID=UPI002A372456|nr:MULTISPECIES: colicin-like pore-forming protein [unclassified Pseudomonas]MDX9674309.1 colicin-like pore-forming protein [Pseudomonas sp. P8_250]WPN37177.1 colicin-like pore-forming protein [Pseudomonas sp. P8_139]WPN41021.1 colicin-like pore-forming protein [Pseudomonas sp. P8_229]
MRQLELPATIFYGDGTWEIVNLSPKTIRGDILKNYPLGNPMHGFTLAIESDYLARKHNLEHGLQTELNLIDSRHPPLTNPTPDTWLNKATNIVNELLFQKNAELQQKLRDVQTARQHSKLQATYDAMLLNEQIANLQNRQTKLYAEIARRQAEALAQQQAAEAARQAEEAQRREHVHQAALAEAKRLQEEKNRIAAEAEAKRIDDYKRAVAYVADANKYILEKYGANLHQVVMDLQKDVSGKKIRSYNDALQTFEQVRTNPRARLSAQDTRAVVDALNALDKATYADNVNRLAKGFGVTGKIVQAHSVIDKTVVGFREGNWKPLMLELESIAAGMGAGALLAVIAAYSFPALAITVPGIVVVGLLIALAAAYLSADNVEKINTLILDQFNSASTKG